LGESALYNRLSKIKFEWISTRLHAKPSPFELIDLVNQLYVDIGINDSPDIQLAKGPLHAIEILRLRLESDQEVVTGKNLAGLFMERAIRKAEAAMKSLRLLCGDDEFAASQNMVFWDLNFQFAQSIMQPISVSEPFRNLQKSFKNRPSQSPCWGDLDWLGYYDVCGKAWQKNIELDRLSLEFVSSGGFQLIAFEHFCVVILRPSNIERNENYALHAETGPAVSWDDGSELYFWNGIEVPAKLIKMPSRVTREEIMAEQNAEKRRCYQEILGSEQFGKLLGIEAIDRKLDQFKNEIILFRTKERDKLVGDHIFFARVICPSTQRVYFLCVPPKIKTADEAVAWTFGKTPGDYNPIVET